MFRRNIPLEKFEKIPPVCSGFRFLGIPHSASRAKPTFENLYVLDKGLAKPISLCSAEK